MPHYSDRVNIVFVEPAFPQNQRRFVAALAGVGANVIGIGRVARATSSATSSRPAGGATSRSRNVTDGHQLDDAVQWAQEQVWVDRLEATVEAHIMAAAEVREACGIPGTSVRTAWLCRDKPSMKEALREAGRPDRAVDRGRHAATRSRAFAERVGFPLILKPRSGAGASGTCRVDDDGRARQAAARGFGGRPTRSPSRSSSRATRASTTRSRSAATSSTTSSSHYYPNVLEAMRTRWISPQFVTTNRIDAAAGYDEVERDRAAGDRGARASAPRPPTWSGSTARRG